MAVQGVPPHALLPRAPSPRPAPPPVVAGVELGLGHRAYDHGSHIRRYYHLSPPNDPRRPGSDLGEQARDGAPSPDGCGPEIAEATPLVPRLNIGALPPARGTVGLSFG
jgi:hypothetical protein